MQTIRPIRPELVQGRVTPSTKFTGTHLYTWAKKATMRVRCFVQEHDTVLQPGLEPRPLNPEYSALSIRPMCLPFPCQPGTQQTEPSVTVCLDVCMEHWCKHIILSDKSIGIHTHFKTKYSQLLPCEHPTITDTPCYRQNPDPLADTPLLQTLPVTDKIQIPGRSYRLRFDWKWLPPLRTLAITELRTLFLVPA